MRLVYPLWGEHHEEPSTKGANILDEAWFFTVTSRLWKVLSNDGFVETFHWQIHQIWRLPSTNDHHPSYCHIWEEFEEFLLQILERKGPSVDSHSIIHMVKKRSLTNIPSYLVLWFLGSGLKPWMVGIQDSSQMSKHALPSIVLHIPSFSRSLYLRIPFQI